MGRPIAIGKESGNSAHQFHRQSGNTDIVPNEFKGPEREEGRQRMDDGNPSAQRKSGGRTDHGLFGNADIDEPFAELRWKGSDGGAIFGRHDDDQSSASAQSWS